MARCKLNADVQARICDGIRRGLTKEQAASLGGVTYGTFQNWERHGEKAPHGKYVDFVAAISVAKAEGADAMLEVVTSAARGRTHTTMPCPHCAGEVEVPGRPGDWKAGAWVLERTHGYTKEKQVNMALSGAVEIDVKVITPPSIEEIRLLLDKVPPVELEAALKRAKGVK